MDFRTLEKNGYISTKNLAQSTEIILNPKHMGMNSCTFGLRNFPSPFYLLFSPDTNIIFKIIYRHILLSLLKKN